MSTTVPVAARTSKNPLALHDGLWLRICLRRKLLVSRVADWRHQRILIALQEDWLLLKVRRLRNRYHYLEARRSQSMLSGSCSSSEGWLRYQSLQAQYSWYSQQRARTRVNDRRKLLLLLLTNPAKSLRPMSLIHLRSRASRKHLQLLRR